VHDEVVPDENVPDKAKVSHKVSADTGSVETGMLQRLPNELNAVAERPTRGSDQSGHDQSGHDQSGHDQSGHDQSGHDQSGHDQSGHDQSGRHRSGPLPCVALCGEFSAGKSSIVNLLLGCDMLPTSILSSTRRPTYLRYAPTVQIEAVSASGEREPVSPETIGLLSREDIDHFEVGMPAELLRHVELLDTPGFADPFHDHHRTLDAVEGTDIGVWCTLATQAWRESEHQTWLSLPSRFRSNGILVVTHVDTLANSGEQARVRMRLEREAGNLFGDIVLLSVPDAVRAVQADGRIADPGLWQESGGKAFVAALEKTVACHAARENSEGEAAATSWMNRGTGVDPGIGATFGLRAAAERRAAATAGPPDAAIPASSDDAAAEPADMKPAPPPVPESERFLMRVMETVPLCQAAVWVDLAGREVLLLREHAKGDVSAILGKAITDLFQGANLGKIDSAFGRGRGEVERHGAQEIFIITDDCVGVLLRSSSRPDRALAVVTNGTVNLGLVRARARTLMAWTDSLP
jgi:hypothetical protein